LGALGSRGIRGWSNRESSRDRGLVIGKGLFWSSFPTFVLCLTKNSQGLSILTAILEPFRVIPEIKKKAVHRGSQSIFPPFYRKGLIEVWYYNLGSP
jgi:hypothetical protein